MPLADLSLVVPLRSVTKVSLFSLYLRKTHCKQEQGLSHKRSFSERGMKCLSHHVSGAAVQVP